MRLVIVGAGKVGATLVDKLSSEDHDVIIVDKDAQCVESVLNKYDVQGVCGGGCDREILDEAGADKADFVIACTDRDESNILCCMMAKKMGAKHTIARVREPEFFSELEEMSREFGIDMIFNPEYRTAKEIAEVLQFPSAINIETFAGGTMSIIELKINAGNPIIGKAISDIIKEYELKILFGLVDRKGQVFIPRGDFVIEENDHVFITATVRELAAFSKKIHIYKQRSKSIFIIGGGKIAYYLANELSEGGINVKIIEIDEKRCIELSEELPHATILLGDGTDQEVLDEEGIKNSDACVALTGIDEQNVIISLYAASRNVGKVITKVDSRTVSRMVRNLGLDTVLAPRNVIANDILRFVRACQAGADAGLNSLYKLHESVEALEFTVSDDYEFLNVPLKDLKIKRNFLVSGIVRDKEYIVPTGESKFLLGDRVLIITTDKRITDLNQIVK